MANARRWFDGKRYWEMQPLHVVKAVAPYRRGEQGRTRAAVRCLLLQIIGYEDCDEIPLDAIIPHRFPGSRLDRVVTPEVADMMSVARDGLLMLGYEAAASELERMGGYDPSVLARYALVNLESGPPSIRIGDHSIYTHTIKRFRGEHSDYVVGRSVSNPRWWYRFYVGKRVSTPAGDRWDPEAGYSFQRRGLTLEDVLAPLYGTEKLEKIVQDRPRSNRTRRRL